MIPAIPSYPLSTRPCPHEQTQAAHVLDPDGSQALPTGEFIFVMTVLGVGLTGFMACLGGAIKLLDFI